MSENTVRSMTTTASASCMETLRINNTVTYGGHPANQLFSGLVHANISTFENAKGFPSTINHANDDLYVISSFYYLF